jgi:RNA polymerase sigma-70 factor (ECF subfamily)
MSQTVTTPEVPEDYYTQLYQQHAGALLNYLQSRLHNHEEAQDLLHEVFLRAWVHREGKPVPKRFLYWIARNLAIDAYRRRSLLDFFSLDILDDNGDECEWYEAVYDPEPAAWETVSLKETVREIFALVESCAPDQQELAFLLVQDLTQQEIADTMGLVKDCVKSRIYRLRQKLNMERSMMAS